MLVNNCAEIYYKMWLLSNCVYFYFTKAELCNRCCLSVYKTSLQHQIKWHRSITCVGRRYAYTKRINLINIYK